MTDHEKIFDLDEIYLREIREYDLQGAWYHWLNDSEVTRFQDKGTFPNTIDKQREYYDTLKKSQSDVLFAIILNENNMHIGNIGLHDINYIHRFAKMGILLGERKYWNKGYATKCVLKIIDYAFNTLNLHKLIVIVLANNTGSIKVFEKCGFTPEGQIKHVFFKNGEYSDAIIFGLEKPQS